MCSVGDDDEDGDDEEWIIDRSVSAAPHLKVTAHVYLVTDDIMDLCSLIGCSVCKSSAAAGVSVSPPQNWFRSQTGSGLQKDPGRFRSTERLRQVQGYRDSDGFRSTETQAGSGLQRDSDRFRATETQTGSGLQSLRRVQVYRDSDRFRSQTGSGLQELLMKMMKVLVLVLVLSCVLCVSADILHEDLAITGCSDSDGEEMYSLDGEEKWVADFINRKGVDPLPDFIDNFNYQEGTYEQAEANQQICRQNLGNSRKGMKDLPLEFDPPSSPMIYPRDDVELGQKNHLICHVTGFYPAPVKIYWTKNAENVTEGTSINVPFPNKDGSFRQMSRLEFIPQLGDIYSCTVKHLALKEPLTKMWDVEAKQQPSIGPAVFCGLGLTVGLLGVAAGTFFLIKGNECS